MQLIWRAMSPRWWAARYWPAPYWNPSGLDFDVFGADWQNYYQSNFVPVGRLDEGDAGSAG
jgi:hypothetical protein